MSDSNTPLPTLDAKNVVNVQSTIHHENDADDMSESVQQYKKTGLLSTFLKLGVASALLVFSISNSHVIQSLKSNFYESTSVRYDTSRRRLSEISEYAAWSSSSVPTYMNGLMEDLAARKKLFDETPPEEVKYWFEYTGPLQVSYLFLLELAWL